MNKLAKLLTIHLLWLLWLRKVAAQNVTVTALSPQPTCPNEKLEYRCQIEFQSLNLDWVHPAFGSLTFVSSTDQVGSMKNTSNGRVVALLTENGMETETHSTLTSILTIQLPLNGLNDTEITCQGFEPPNPIKSGLSTILLAGIPSPPDNLQSAVPMDLSTFQIEWNPPVYVGGNRTFIQSYRISILDINYSEEEDGTAHSHIITTNGTNVKFNTPYMVQVTAINTCELESNPANITIDITAAAPPELSSLSADLLCSVERVRRVDLQWQYGTGLSSVYTPPIETLMVKVDGPAEISANECSDLKQSDVKCSFNITEGGTYVVTLNISNEIGMTLNGKTLNFDPLLVNDTFLVETPPRLLVSVNGLCQDGEYTVTVAFGTRHNDMVTCVFEQTDVKMKMLKSPGNMAVTFSVPANIVAVDGEEYCYKAELSNVQDVVGGGGGGNSSTSAGQIIGLVCGLYFGVYVGVVSGSASNMYWILPLVAGLSGSLVVLMAIGMITSIAVFPIGIVLLIVTCCCCHEKKSGNECYDSSYHNETMAKFLFYLGIVTSIIIFPLGIAAVLLYLCKYKYARCVVISFGITGAVMVFPIGLVLLLISCCCCREKESDDRPHMQFHDLSNCHKALVYIGGVASAIIFPFGVVIFIYHHCSKSRSKEKDDQDMKNLRSGSSPDPESPPTKEPPPTGPMYQDPSTIQHQAHPETGEMYAVVQESSKKKKKKKGEEPTGVMYQDPQSIEDQQAESGDMYAMPQKEAKKKKKGKKGEELAQMYSTVDKNQKQKSEGLVYADLDVHSSAAKPPPSQVSEYADIKH